MVERNDWGFEGVSDEDIEALKMERTLLNNLSSTQQALTLMQEASPAAALQVIKIMKYAENDRVRLQAAQWILDRAGVGHDVGGNSAAEPWTDLIESTTRKLEDHANGGE